MAPSLFGTTDPTPATIAAATATELGDELTLILRDTKQIRERLEGTMGNMVKDMFSRFEALCPHKQFDEDMASISETTKNIAARLDGLVPGTDMEPSTGTLRRSRGASTASPGHRTSRRFWRSSTSRAHSRGSKSTSWSSRLRWRLPDGPRPWPPRPPSPPM